MSGTTLRSGGSCARLLLGDIVSAASASGPLVTKVSHSAAHAANTTAVCLTTRIVTPRFCASSGTVGDYNHYTLVQNIISYSVLWKKNMV